MLVKNFKAIVDAFDKSTDELKGVIPKVVANDTPESNRKLQAMADFISNEMRRLRSFVLDAVVADEAENENKKGGK